jgi:DNA invertase Pin-like site-specific DNA recombinase
MVLQLEDVTGVDAELKEACGYIRVSCAAQDKGYSPEVQRAAVIKAAGDHGYGYLIQPDMICQDTMQGYKTTREGYQKVVSAVRQSATPPGLTIRRWD